jgi:arabinose-5-phosphate isomerase
MEILTTSKIVINNHQILQTAKQVIATEQQAIVRLIESINDNFIQAVHLLINCKARIVITGVGKSGHIGSKMAATFASLGSPALFLHAGEALHGDIGMLTPDDVVIALSFSGNTDEIINILPSLKNLNVPIIAITGNAHSILAKAAHVHLPVHIDKEACHLNLAPSASTTATLVLGDALAIAVTKAKQFTEEDFARSHPGGNLGRKLLLKVSDVMLTQHSLATATPDTKFTDALVIMTSKSLGMLAIIDEEHNVLGIFTDGDLRRLFYELNNRQQYLDEIKMTEIMNTNCITINQDTLADTAWQIIKEKKINGLLVTDENNKLIGMLNIHTLTNSKII